MLISNKNDKKVEGDYIFKENISRHNYYFHFIKREKNFFMRLSYSIPLLKSKIYHKITRKC